MVVQTAEGAGIVNGQPGRAAELQRRDAEQEESLQRVRSPWGRRAAA